MKNSSYLAVAAVLFLFSTHAGAIELGEINLDSHLGEAFHAEVPLALGEGEEISNLFVELAAPADYRALNVYRDPALSLIRVDITGDGRGSRIELSSRSPVDTPFFTLLLKVRYARATHYKKYPVFLNISRTDQPLKAKVPLPTVSVNDLKKKPAITVTASPPTLSVAEDSEGKSSAAEEKATHRTAPAFKPFDRWARTSHYGPVVYGDSIFTIADRLRIDKRYSIKQVAVALFEKNRSRFAQDNINLVMHGTYLNVPMAEEVERLSYKQALTIIKEHNRHWRELIKQPRYAAVAEAQRTRYSKRMRVAEDIKAVRAASGIAATPVSEQ